ncbi:MAG: protein translocase subunit SecF [Gammaproteobacteria bacterium]|nr:MAG: protein translocase subunit SecF [Gammaproteobacteria bacterium]
MQIIKQLKINFMEKRQIAMILSSVLVLLSITSFFVRGFNLGLDFTGGYLLEVEYPQQAKLDNIRKDLKDNGYKRASVQYFGTNNNTLIRLAPQKDKKGATISDDIMTILKEKDDKVTIRRVEFVGPQVGEDLREQGGLAIIYALGFILLYITIRFEKRFSVGAVLAILHDVIITLGIFSIFGVGFDLTVLAAILAVIGYSLNDTIVVFDRIRENFKITSKSVIDVLNLSINQTLSRTIITSLTTMLVLLALFLLGGAVIHGFALALIIGIVVGTYSSIFIASTSILAMGLKREDLMSKKPKETLES